MTHTPHPLRRQRKRIKGWRQPKDGGVYVGRGRGCKWGNPFKTAEEFEQWLYAEWQHWGFDDRPSIYYDLHELRGKPLWCWCALDQLCHGDVLAELANKEVV